MQEPALGMCFLTCDLNLSMLICDAAVLLLLCHFLYCHLLSLSFMVITLFSVIYIDIPCIEGSLLMEVFYYQKVKRLVTRQSAKDAKLLMLSL